MEAESTKPEKEDYEEEEEDCQPFEEEEEIEFSDSEEISILDETASSTPTTGGPTRSSSPKPDASTERELERLRKKWDKEIQDRKNQLKNGNADASENASKKWWYADNRDKEEDKDDGEEREQDGNKIESVIKSKNKGKERERIEDKKAEGESDSSSNHHQQSSSTTSSHPDLDSIPDISFNSEYHPTTPFPTDINRLPSGVSSFGTDWRSQISNSALPFSTSSANAISTSHPQTRAKVQDGAENSENKVNLEVPTKGNPGTKNNIKTAVKIYAKAVQDERSGRLDEALTGYRRAFRVNSHADKLYQRAVSLFTALETGEGLQDQSSSTSSSSVSTPRQWGKGDDDVLGSQEVLEQIRAAMEGDDYRYVKIKAEEERIKNQVPENPSQIKIDNVQQDFVRDPSNSGNSSSEDQDELTLLLTRLSTESEEPKDFSKVKFEPEDEEKSMFLNDLPDEILLLVLANLVAPRGRRGAKLGGKNTNTNTNHLHLQSSSSNNTSESANKTIQIQDPILPSAPKSRPRIQGIGVVLAGPDWQALESVARVCWKFRLLSRAHELWRMIVHETYFPPQIKIPEPPKPSEENLVEQESRPLGEGEQGQVENVTEETNTTTPAIDETTPLQEPTNQTSVLQQQQQQIYSSKKSNSNSNLSADVLSTILPSLLESLYSRHSKSWRSVFINEPRLRLNGTYISSCHYTRSGMSEESVWVNVIHVVEFYRSLRFLPDGKVLSLLTTDLPNETVKRMEENSLKGVKGFSIGRWELRPQGLDQESLDDFLGGIDYSNLHSRENGLETIRKINSLIGSPTLLIWDLKDETLKKYTFRMLFSLRQTSKGKWNKLEMVEYASRNEVTGETVPIPQKHARPFIFSRVMAYGV